VFVARVLKCCDAVIEMSKNYNKDDIIEHVRKITSA